MTALSARSDEVARRMAPLVREMMLAEVARAVAAERETHPDKTDIEIMEACRAVARAVDLLAGAKFTAGEIVARRRLEASAAALAKLMRRHGRMPRGE